MTRMWMVDPELLCRQHLLGEHKEVHQLVGQIRRGCSLRGYVAHNCVEPEAIEDRHEALAEEMLRRGYRHASPLPPSLDLRALVDSLSEDDRTARVDIESSYRDLLGRCSSCRERVPMPGEGE